MDQTRPTLWILVKNWRFFSCFTKNNGFTTFIWVMLKTALKKLVRFSIGRKIAKNHSIFKKKIIFRILRFFSFEQLQEKFGFWQFLEVSVTIFEKLQKISTFFNDFIILTSQTSFDLTNFDKFYLIGTTLPISKL